MAGKVVETRLGKVHRLSPLQRRLVAAQLTEPRSPALNMSLLVRFPALDVDRFVAAFDATVQSTDILRMRIDRNRPDRAVVDPLAGPFTSIEQLSDADPEPWATRLIGRPLDPTEGVFRSQLGLHEDGSASWVLTVHHVATDATASSLIVDRTVRHYLGESVEPSRFFSWLDDQRADPKLSDAQHQWDSDGFDLASGAVRAARPATQSGVEATRHGLDEQAAARLRQAVDGELRLLTPDLSLTAALATVAAACLHQRGATSARLGIPLHHRAGPSVDLVGPTLGIYPLVVEIPVGTTAHELHRSVTRELLGILRHAHPAAATPADFDAIVNVIPRAAVRPPAELPFTVNWLHPGAIDPDQLFRVQATAYGSEGVDVSLDIPNDDHHLERRFTALLLHLFDDLDATVSEPPELPGERLELIQATERGPALTRAQPLAHDLHDALHASDQPALISDDEVLTGEQLWAWVGSVAAYLVEATPEQSRIAVELDRSAEAIVAILACVRAGRSFVPVDPEHPPHHRRQVLERAQPTLTISDRATIRERASSSIPAPDSSVDPDAEAYLLFTSGSTGEPKGVPITHQALANYIGHATETYFDGAGADIAAVFTALTFDLTLTSIFAPLVRGSALRIIEPSGVEGLHQLAQAVDVTWAKATPSHLAALLPLLGDGHRLRNLVVGGEAFHTPLANAAITRLPALTIYNEYGPTEAVVGCCVHRSDQIEPHQTGPVPIGMPIAGVELRVIDETMPELHRRCELGEAGELWIAHPGLTRGYIGGIEEQRFVELDGRRFYRTGDRVIRDESGSLSYLGRIDDEIKVNGMRLDPALVEQAIEAHPAIAQGTVRLWSPEQLQATHYCVRCGLSDAVPTTTFDEAGVCNRCHAFDDVAEHARDWFGEEPDLAVFAADWRERRTGTHDCVFLLSGGKDSTYALYRLVEQGITPLAFTYDNGYLSEQAKRNVDAAVEDLGIDHVYGTTEHAIAIFRDSLAVHSDVCHGCYKALYTLAINEADQRGIPALVTGLSRGQLFETRLVPGQFDAERFDPSAIDSAVLEARKRYHRAPDFPNQVLDTAVFATDDVFDRIDFVDIYRYLDVELDEVMRFLDTETPWQRPADTGRSSNCLINVAGIRTHEIERGWHNYAEPYAWDVRLGHKTRSQALQELDDPVDEAELRRLFDELGYRPQPRRLLTAWFTARAGQPAPTPSELAHFVSERVPAWAVPASFVEVQEMPLNSNGKVARDRLPAPERSSRAAVGATVAAETDLERLIVERWQTILDLHAIGIDDDFFALGGDSLAAISMILGLSRAIDRELREELGFRHTTVRELARAIEDLDAQSTPTMRSEPIDLSSDDAPPLTSGETSLLFEQLAAPDNHRYHVGRVHHVKHSVDIARFTEALVAAASRHSCFRWSYASDRTPIAPEEAAVAEATTLGNEAERSAFLQRPFDLVHGPLIRCGIDTQEAETTIVIALHHVCGDHRTLNVLWQEMNRLYHGDSLDDQAFDLPALDRWLGDTDEVDQEFWSTFQGATRPRIATRAPAADPDGYVAMASSHSKDQLRLGLRGIPAAAAITAAAIASAPSFPDDTVEVCLVASRRTHPQSHDVCGYLLNPVPIQLTIGRSTSVAEVHQQVMEELARVLPHSTYAFADIVADARRRKMRPPTGAILVSYIEDPPLFFGREGLGDDTVDHEIVFNGHAVSDLTYFLDASSDELSLGIEYSGETVGEATASGLLARFGAAYDALFEAPLAPAGAIGATEPGSSWQTGPDLPEAELILDRLYQQRTQRPDEIAVSCDERTLTWAELVGHSEAIAARLHDHGLARGDRVLVAVGRSAYAPAAVAGVLLAGGVYVPLDPTSPQARLEAAVAAADPAAVLLISGNNHPGLDEATETVAFRLNVDEVEPTTTGPAGSLAHLPGGQPIERARAEEPAYMILTSGSTGRPNGVVITHGQLAQSTSARALLYEHDPASFLMVSSFAFDSSMVGLFWSFWSGAKLILPTDLQAADPDALLEIIIRHEPDFLLCVPTLYALLIDRAPADAPWLNHVIVAGERCTRALADRHHARGTTAKLTNEYGPTEATVWATAHSVVVASGPVPIGKPIPGTWTAVIDRFDRIVDEGVEGELVIGGPSVCAGYVSTADAARFEPLPYEFDGIGTNRVFRTGDRCVVHNGEIHFLGRTDEQLSIAGQRIEVGEIESALSAIDGVSAAAVIGVDTRPLEFMIASLDRNDLADSLRAASEADDPQAALREELARQTPAAAPALVAHIESQEELNADFLRTKLKPLLPASAIPHRFEVSRQLPRGATGKIDRTELQRRSQRSTPSGSSPAVATSTSAIGSDVLDLVRSTIGDLLGIDAVGNDESFFDLGGDSLGAFTVIQRLERAVGRQLPMRSIHDAPTPRGLAAAIGSMASSADRSDTIVTLDIETGHKDTHIVFLHNLGVNAQLARKLSAALGSDWPVAAMFDARTVTSPYDRPHEQQQFVAIDALVQEYADAVEQLVPTNPVVLVGYCQGGIHAHEVAVELNERGRSVPLVVTTLDWHAPDIEFAHDTWIETLALGAEQSDRGVIQHSLDVMSRGIAKRYVMRQARRLAGRASRRLRLNNGYSRMLEIADQTGRSYEEHEYSPYDGRVLIVRSSDHPLTPPELGSTGWSSVLTDYSVRYLSGKPFEAPAVDLLAEAIQDALD